MSDRDADRECRGESGSMMRLEKEVSVQDFCYCKSTKFKMKGFMAPWRQLQPVRERDEGVANGLGVIYIERECAYYETLRKSVTCCKISTFLKF